MIAALHTRTFGNSRSPDDSKRAIGEVLVERDGFTPEQVEKFLGHALLIWGDLATAGVLARLPPAA